MKGQREREIMEALRNELIAFALTEGMGFATQIALDRRLRLIAKAAAESAPMPKPSRLYHRQMIGVTKNLNLRQTTLELVR